MTKLLSLLRMFIATPFFAELVRQSLRWIGVWLMTIGVPESIAGLTSREDAIMGVIGFVAYLAADTGWAAGLVTRYKAWRARH